MEMRCNNKVATYIANNPMFHECTKHVEIDCHYTRDLIQRGLLFTTSDALENQTADMFTKPLARSAFEACCDKLSMIYAPT
jgi:hypothetical protein